MELQIMQVPLVQGFQSFLKQKNLMFISALWVTLCNRNSAPSYDTICNFSICYFILFSLVYCISWHHLLLVLYLTQRAECQGI